MKNSVIKIIFVYLIYLQVISIYIGYDIDVVKVFKFSLFQLGLLPAIALVFFESFKYFKKQHKDPNKLVIKLIAIYSAYQIFIILPLTYYQANIKVTELYWQLMPRLYFLLVPFIYWFVIPQYKKITTPINWISYSSIVLLFLSFYNYLNNVYFVTNTGDLRLVSGVAGMIYAFTLFTSLSLFSHSKNKPIIIAVSLIGFVFANHRSAYVMLGLMLLLSIFVGLVNREKIKFKLKTVFVSVLIIIVLLISLSQIPLIKENFTGRITSVFDVTDSNAQDRLLRWGLAFTYFLSNPINGSMLENKYYGDDVFLREAYPPHNFVLEILPTQGIVGLLFILVIFFYIIKLGYRNKSDNISYQMFLVVVFYILYSLMNVTFLNDWNILILVFSSAMILYRNKQLQNAE
jgi:O-antigen ligase